MRTANRRSRRTRKQKMRSALFKISETTGSRIGTDPRSKDHHNAAIVIIPDPEITGIEMGNIASTVKSRTTHKKNAGKESERTSHVKTNKDVPTGAYWCM
jgi:hypothetical protein